ncbi:MAG: DUF4397 domain-containing protein [Bacteroidetes bacterium]|nr:DUF4397 domain-containing protein [Bacteroidota bacterium]
MMKHSIRLLSLCVALGALTIGSILSGCKDTAPDPSYVDFGSIRVMHFIQCTAVRFIAYPLDNISDTVLNTPTPVTYGVSTPYVNNLSTGRGAGQTYRVVALVAGTTTELDHTDITLKPGDKWTWVLFQPDGGNYHSVKIQDLPVSNPTANTAYFRFMNVNPGGPEHLYLGDPNGTDFSGAVDFGHISDYKGIPTSFDTTVTFFVTDANNNILGRLSGVSLTSGSYHTITWGGQLDQTCRLTDFNGNHIPDDSIRVHMFDDNESGNDQLPVPVTMRYNIINALMPPNAGAHAAGFPDYTASGGLNVVINNNTVYDYKNVMPFTPLPFWGNIEQVDPDNSANKVLISDPKAIPYTGLAYIKLVKPVGQNPSFSDSILFRFYGTSARIQTDQLVSFIINDTTHSSKSAQTAVAPYDSTFAFTLPVPDQSDANSATIIFVNCLVGTKSTPTVLKGDFTIGSNTITMQPRPAGAPQPFTGIPADQQITISGKINSGAETIPDFKFSPQKGAVYEVICVGQRNRPDGNSAYAPHFMVVRTNPKW